MKTIKIYISLLIISSFLIILSSCNILNDNEQNIPVPTTGLYSINIDGTYQKELTSGEIGGFAFGGNHIIYGYISTMNIDGSNQHNLLTTNLTPIDFSVSPDGAKIIFSTGQYIFIMNTDGSDIQKINIPDTISNKSNPHLSYDGSTLVFEGFNGIYEIDTNGENIMKLIDNTKLKGTRYIDPSFSPDDNNIIFGEFSDSISSFISMHKLNLNNLHDTLLFSFVNSSGDYYEVSLNNTILLIDSYNIHEVNINNFADKVITKGSDAHYSSDFSKITYIDLDGTSINIINLETNEVTKVKSGLTRNSFSEPKLSPDGTRIVFTEVTYSF